MIATLNGTDTIKTLSNGQYRAHRMGIFWVGDFRDFGHAERALQIANSQGATVEQRGIYDGACNAAEDIHLAAILATAHAGWATTSCACSTNGWPI